MEHFPVLRRDVCVNRGGWGLPGLDDVLRNLVIDDEVDDFFKKIERWVVVLLAVIVIARTSRTQSRGTTAVFLIPRYV